MIDKRVAILIYQPEQTTLYDIWINERDSYHYRLTVLDGNLARQYAAGLYVGFGASTHEADKEVAQLFTDATTRCLEKTSGRRLPPYDRIGSAAESVFDTRAVMRIEQLHGQKVWRVHADNGRKRHFAECGKTLHTHNEACHFAQGIMVAAGYPVPQSGAEALLMSNAANFMFEKELNGEDSGVRGKPDGYPWVLELREEYS